MTIRRQISCRCLQMNCRVAADGSKWAYRAVDKLQRAIYKLQVDLEELSRWLYTSIGAVQMALELQCALEKQQMALEKLQRSCKLYYMSYIIEGSREESRGLQEEQYMSLYFYRSCTCRGSAGYRGAVVQALESSRWFQRRAQMSSSCRGAVQGFKGAVDGSRGAVHVYCIGHRALYMSCKVAVQQRALEEPLKALGELQWDLDELYSDTVQTVFKCHVSKCLQTSRQFWDLLKKMTFGDVSSHTYYNMLF